MHRNNAVITLKLCGRMLPRACQGRDLHRDDRLTAVAHTFCQTSAVCAAALTLRILCGRFIFSLEKWDSES